MVVTSNLVCFWFEGIRSLRYLEWLNLSGNSIEVNCNFSGLYFYYINFSLYLRFPYFILQEIENLDENTNLTHLDLSDNR